MNSITIQFVQFKEESFVKIMNFSHFSHSVTPDFVTTRNFVSFLNRPIIQICIHYLFRKKCSAVIAISPPFQLINKNHLRNFLHFPSVFGYNYVVIEWVREKVWHIQYDKICPYYVLHTFFHHITDIHFNSFYSQNCSCDFMLIQIEKCSFKDHDR